MIRGGSLKKIEKKIIPNVPTNKKVYTNASIKNSLIDAILQNKLAKKQNVFFYSVPTKRIWSLNKDI